MAAASRYYTITEVCSLTGLPETTVRFYDSLYRDILPPKVYRGTQALYSKESAQLIVWINELKKQGIVLPADIRTHLRQRALSARRRKEKPFGKVIVVTSGKGGVGKSNIALNLGIALSRMGKKTVLIDGDLGLANLHILCGTRPSKTLHQAILKGVPINEVIEEGPAGLRLIAGGTGIDEMANLPNLKRGTLIGELEKLESSFDCLIIDTSPGIGRGVTDFVQMGDRVILITTPDLTSTTDAYGLLKIASKLSLRNGIGVLCNQARTKAQAEGVFARLEVCARRFLQMNIRSYGYLPRDPAVPKSNQIQKPYILAEPESRIAQYTYNLAEIVLEKEAGEPPKTQSSFRALVRRKEPQWQREPGITGGRELLPQPGGIL